MDEVLSRFPHLGEQIFRSLDFENLSNCTRVSKCWGNFIFENEKVVGFQSLIEIIQNICGKRPKHLKELLYKVYGAAPGQVQSLKIQEGDIRPGDMVYVKLSNWEMLRQKKLLKQCKREALMKMSTAAIRFIKKEQQGYFKGYGITLLHLAAICGQYDILKKLFDSGATKLLHDKYDYRGRTALSFAVFYNHPDACQLILEYERVGNPIVFKALDSVGAGVGRAPPEFGGSETRGRKRKRQSTTIGTPGVEKLTTALVLSEGCTLLHWASKNGHDNLFRYIFEGLIDKNPDDHIGNTPLHFAAEKGNFAICKLIIDKIPCKNPKNDANVTPLQLAVINNHFNVIELIQSALENDKLAFENIRQSVFSTNEQCDCVSECTCTY